jgi:hypothetical protein
VENDSLSFGKAWHMGLELAYNGDPGDILACFAESPKHEKYLKAMFFGYKNLYKPTESFNVIATELKFEIFIRPPHKGRAARGIRFRGVIDMVIERDDGIWIMEHKTAGCINGAYIDKLWHDLQIMLYAYAYQEMTGKKVTGIIYNIAQKSRLKQRGGETEAEFNARYTEAIAKSKTGKTSIKRKMPETDEEFQDRLNKQYEDPSMFHREEILCDDQRIQQVKKELWEIHKAMKTKNFYKNRAQCFVFGECEYFKLCNAGENQIIIDNYYKKKGGKRINATNEKD